MKAEVLPLDGKYYGTEVLIYTDDGSKWLTTIWVGRGKPSRREYEQCTECECDGKSCDMIDYSHYESEDSLRLAEIFSEAVNKYES